MLALSAATRAAQLTFPATAQASAAPTTTGTIDKLSVRGRAAAIQADSLKLAARVDGWTLVIL
jgi:hypothetical protein